MITEKRQSNGINIAHNLPRNPKMELRKKKPASEVLDNTANGIEEEGGDVNHNDIQVEEYNNCTHGDLADYTCVECLYNRWRSQANFKKPEPETVEVIDEDNVKLEKLKSITIEKVTEKEPKVSKDTTREAKEEKNGVQDDMKDRVKEGVKEESVDPVEIINSVNWLEVFKYVGISIPVINIE
eukprot:GFUD01013584.1.p1 GENE.GFUD01013584.1~~GFUD01013584.1.p1  ORF type:complete len:183 (+),score=47.25 GFUD01013584.1:170-718(+)